MSAPRVILRRHVPDDLGRIIDYLAQNSDDAPDAFAVAINETLDDLVQAPEKGSPKRFRGRKLSGIRTWAVNGFPNHLILYKVVDVGIEVWADVHGEMDLPRLLRDRI